MRCGRHAATPSNARAATDVGPPRRRAGHGYLGTLDLYQQDAAREGAHFVEIQNTMLFATVGQRTDAESRDASGKSRQPRERRLSQGRASARPIASVSHGRTKVRPARTSMRTRCDPCRPMNSMRTHDRSLPVVAGWDDYAEFYDWENAQTMARRDVPFWRRLALAADGPVLELGCGTGRVTLPLARAGAAMVGVDLSAPMLKRARTACARARLRGRRARLVRGDIRALPFPDARFAPRRGAVRHPAVAARERDLTATLRAVPDVLASRRPARHGAGRRPAVLARVPRRDPAARVASRPTRRISRSSSRSARTAARGLTLFEQEFVERRGRAR